MTELFKVTAYVSKDTKAKVIQKAKEQNRSESNLLAIIIEAYIIEEELYFKDLKNENESN